MNLSCGVGVRGDRWRDGRDRRDRQTDRWTDMREAPEQEREIQMDEEKEVWETKE